MPAPIEAFREENSQHSKRFLQALALEVGGGVLMVAGVSIENKLAAIAGLAISVFGGAKIAIESFNHQIHLDDLNMQPMRKGDI